MEAVLPQNLKGYELRERIGAGGFGAVYRAYQSTVGREVAIKIILPGLANQPEFIRRFEGEAQIVARLEHPHITPLYDYWRDPDGAYLVMRWLRGGSLRDVLQQGAFDLRSAALLLDQVAGALSLAHRNHVIHRDIKPGNILLDEDGNAYLTDFGIAKDLNLPGNNTQPDAIIGSLDYLSPEQARSEPITARTDIYSLGVTLYEVITGTHPFQNLSAVERLYKHINDPLPDITTLDAAVTIQVNRVIQKATAKNPDHRYPDALAFAADFREAIGMNRTPTSTVELLTQREQEVLQLIIDGNANKEIAQRLTVTLSTVKWYVNQIYAKLGVRSRVQAMVRARELNLLAKSSESLSATIIPTGNFQPENPYKGLRAFQSADNQDFFGREKVTAKLIKRLEEAHEFGRFLAVIGPSGSGKSSLVKAGLIPALWRGDLPKSEKWFIVELLPSAHPIDELEIALTRVAANLSGSLHEQLSRDRRGLIRTAQLILPNDGSELVLVIDQFEEVFTLLEDEAVRVQFLDLLCTAVTEPRSRVRIIITLRADFYDRPLHYADFGELVRSRMETILPLSAEELERAISKPSERVGVSFEPGLVASIVAEVNYQAGALPLLQYALTELFEQRKGHRLTREAYDAIGGTIGALARRADEVYLDFDAASQEVARQMFLRLVTLGEGVEDTRRRVKRSELLAIAPDPDVMEEVIDTYVEYRLLSLDNEPGTRSPTVEVAHEAILRAWDRLRSWLTENRDEIKLQRQLGVMAAEWSEEKQDTSFLARGSRLTQFEKWADETTLAITSAERRYLDTSILGREKEAQVELQRQKHERSLEKRAERFLRGLVIVLAFALLGAITLTGTALTERTKSEANLLAVRELALINGAQSAFFSDDFDTARTLSLAAVIVTDHPSAHSQLILAESAYAPGTVRLYADAQYNQSWSAATLSPDRRFLVTVPYTDEETSPVVWNLDTGNATRFFPQAYAYTVWDAVFRPTSEGEALQLLTTSPDGTMNLWDFTTAEPLRRFQGHEAGIWGAQFSADGRQIIAASDNTMILWNTDTGEIVRTFEGHTAAVESIQFSPDDSMLLSASFDGTVGLWDLASGRMIDQFEVGLQPNSAIFSPDGTKFLVASLFDMRMSLWDIASHSEIRSYRRRGPIGSQYFGHDGQTITAAAGDWITTWNIETGEVVRVLAGHTSGITRVFPDADESQLFSVGVDSTIRLWDLDDGAEITRTQSLRSEALMDDGDISPDGQMFVIAAGGNTLRPEQTGLVILYDAVAGTEIRRFGVNGIAHSGNTGSVRFSPDGQTVLSADWSGEIRRWDVTSGSLMNDYQSVNSAVNSVDFTPDGSAFIAAADEGAVVMINVATEGLSRRFSFPTPVAKAIFIANATQFLACLSDNTIVLVDVSTGNSLFSLTGTTQICLSLAVSPDGLTAVSGHLDGSIYLWDLTTEQLIRRFTETQGRINELIFSPDGRSVYTASHAGSSQTVTVWDVATGQPYRHYTGHQNPVDALDLTPDGRTLLTASYDGTARLWRVDRTFEELLAWTRANRYIPELTCSQRELYRLEPLCEPESAQLTTASG